MVIGFKNDKSIKDKMFIRQSFPYCPFAVPLRIPIL